MQNVDVIVHIQGQVVTGVISLPDGKRLSDYLNGDFNKQSYGSGKFLELTDAKTDSGDGIKKKTDTIYINKEAIQMLRTLEKDSARGIGTEKEQKQYPFVQKIPVRVTMSLPDCDLSGYLHCTNKEEISNLFTSELPFLPCTDARVQVFRENYSWNTGFVAINKSQVHSVQYS